MKNLLKHRGAIYGSLAVWIILFHIDRRLGNVIQIPVLKQILQCGNLAVDLFMFFSGCCLYLSLDKRYDIKGFFKRRVFRLLPAYLFFTLPYWIWNSLAAEPGPSGGFYLTRFLADLSTASFWLLGTQTVWFVDAILIFYILFPLIFKAVKKGGKTVVLLLIAVYALNILAANFVPLYDNSSIAWTRLPIFIIGALAGKHLDELDLKKLRKSTAAAVTVAAAVILFSAIVIFNVGALFTADNIKSEYLFMFLYGPLTMCAVTVMSALPFGSGKNPIGRGLAFLGGISVELYMAHIIILNVFRYYDLMNILGLAAFAVVPALALLWIGIFLVCRKLLTGDTKVRG